MRRLTTQLLLAAAFVLVLPLAASAISATNVSPAGGAADVCVDTPLSITFDQAPQVGATGRVRVFRSDGTLVDTIDISVDTNPNVPGQQSQRQIGGAQSGGQPYLFNYYPVIVTGNTAAIYLHQALDYGQTYYVTIDPGVFRDAEGNPLPGIVDPDTWRFTTKAAGPAPGTTALTVAADDTGDFCTVQGAIDFVPQNNTRPVVITVRGGTYNEINYVRSNKPLITVRGEDRDQTVIQYANNANLNMGNNRAMFGVDAPDFTLETVTLHNTTPQGGSQAEAFRSGNLRVRLDRVNLMSFQDTLLMQGQGSVTNSYIEGDVDFMWGGGAVFFQNCELKALRTNLNYYVQARNPLGSLGIHNGYVYVNCRLTRAPNVGDATSYLARIDPRPSDPSAVPPIFGWPFSQVVYINCAMDAHIRPEGWLLNNATDAPNVQFWEYRSTDLNGDPLDVSRRAPFSRQLTDEEAAFWSDPANVLAVALPVRAESSGLVYRRSDQTFHGTITVTNTTSQVIQGPLQVVLMGLTRDVTLVGASGARGGRPYITSGITSLAPGASVTVPVQFSNPSNARIGYFVTAFSSPF